MSINDFNGEGNVPDRNIQEEKTLTVAGVPTKVQITDTGDVLVEQPDLEGQELETWQEKAKNEIKALKVSNDKYSEARKIKSESEKLIDEANRRIKLAQDKEDLLLTKITELENRLNSVGQTRPQNDGNWFGFQSKEDLSNALVDSPEEVLANLTSTIEKKYDKKLQNQLSNVTMQVAIEREGYNFQEVKAFADSMGATVNPNTFDTYKRINSKAPAKSQFDDINRIQENSITFVKGSRGTKKGNEPDDIFSRMSSNTKVKDLNDF